MSKFERGRRRLRAQHEIRMRGPSEDLIEEQIENLPDEVDLSKALEGIIRTWDQSPKIFRSSIIDRAYNKYCLYPTLLPTISSMMGVFCLSTDDFKNSLTTYLVKKLKEHQTAKKFNDVFVLIRFLSDLVNASVYSCSSIISIYHALLSTVKSHVPTLYINWVLLTVMDSLIWMAAEASQHEHNMKELEKIISLIYQIKMDKNVMYVKGFRTWIDKSNKVPHGETIDVAWKNLVLLRDAGWKWPGVVRPYFELAELNKLNPIDFPVCTFTITQKLAYLPCPEIFTQLFSENLRNEREGVNLTNYLTFPTEGNIVRRLFAERLTALFASTVDMRKAASVIENMINDPVYEVPFFVVEYILLDVVSIPIGKVSLTLSASLSAYFHTKSPRFKDAFEKGVMIVLERIDIMNLISLDRFVCWFAYFLSILDCAWPWDMMLHFINLPNKHPGFMFITELFFQLKLICGTYFIKNEAMLEAFKDLFEDSDDPDYRYGKDSEFDEKHGDLRNQIVKVYTEKKFSDILSLKPNFPDDFSPFVEFPSTISQMDALFIEAIIQFTLKTGHKILGQGLQIFYQMQDILQSVLSTEDEQVYALHCIHSFWRKNPIRLEATFMHLFCLKIVSPVAVIRFVFDDRAAAYHKRFYFWNIIEKMLAHMAKLINELKSEFLKLNRVSKSKKSNVILNDSDNLVSESGNDSSISDNESESEESSNSHSDISDKVRHRTFGPCLSTIKSMKKLQTTLEEEKAAFSAALFCLLRLTVKFGGEGKAVGKDYFSVLHRLQNNLISNFKLLKSDLFKFESILPSQGYNSEETLILIVYQRFSALFQ